MTAAPRILLATTLGGYNHAAVLDSVLAQALDVRGATPEFLLCDAALPACQMTKKGRASAPDIVAGTRMKYCDTCIAKGTGLFAPLGYAMRRISAYLTEQERADARALAASTTPATLRALQVEGLPVGDHAHAGALRYFGRGDLRTPEEWAVAQRFLEAGILTVRALFRLFAAERYDVVVAHHGIYIPQGMIVEVARKLGIRVVTYNPAYRKHSFIFSHGKSYHYTMPEEEGAAWENIPMPDERRAALAAYLASRRHGSNDWIWFHDKPVEDISPALRARGIDPAKPYVALLTSVAWDAQLHYASNAFGSMMEWIFATVYYWKTRPELPLIIRVHPAEVRGAMPSTQKVKDELARHFRWLCFSRLPKNVHVIAPEEQLSTYALCDGANAVIIYNTKTGVEVSVSGIPIIVAGEAWIRGKGFSQDVSSPEAYTRLLDDLPLSTRMSDSQRARAERYAYHFFFRRMIPLPFIDQGEKADFHADIQSKHDLAPGRWPGLDVMCQGILEGTPFVYDGGHGV